MKKSMMAINDNILNDQSHMRVALRLAARGLGSVWPNPSVGCVIVKDNIVISRGVTGAYGRPHGEDIALKLAGDKANGATLYVTLEPCSHHGKTPPCAEAIIKSGIKRVVIAIGDPDPRVSGNGILMLKNAAIKVDIGCMKDEARYISAGFLMRINHKRPLVAIKTATTLDGYIATNKGNSKWITGDQARMAGHQLRAKYDAILIGSGTAIADDPMLNCRISGFTGRQPVRIVLDSNLNISLNSKLVKTAKQQPIWIITAVNINNNVKNHNKFMALQELGVKILQCKLGDNNHIDIVAAIELIGKKGITRLLVEGGGKLSASLFKANIVDLIYWFRAAAIIGGDGIAAISAYGVDNISMMQKFNLRSIKSIGLDRLEIYDLK